MKQSIDDVKNKEAEVKNEVVNVVTEAQREDTDAKEAYVQVAAGTGDFTTSASTEPGSLPTLIPGRGEMTDNMKGAANNFIAESTPLNSLISNVTDLFGSIDADDYQISGEQYTLTQPDLFQIPDGILDFRIDPLPLDGPFTGQSGLFQGKNIAIPNSIMSLDLFWWTDILAGFRLFFSAVIMYKTAQGIINVIRTTT
jgi:hypothetical protein